MFFFCGSSLNRYGLGLMMFGLMLFGLIVVWDEGWCVNGIEWNCWCGCTRWCVGVGGGSGGLGPGLDVHWGNRAVMVAFRTAVPDADANVRTG